MKNFFLLSLCLFSSSAFAFEVLEKSVVKVHSGLCQNQAVQFKGSGVLFQYQNKVYVLTSEHVVLHGSAQEFCHWVQNSNWGKVNTQLKTADWGYGLALLEIEKPSQDMLSQAVVLDLKAVALQNKGQNIGVTTFGYPHQSKELAQDSSGKVLVLKSQRHEIPLLSYMVELVDAHGEYGMSGGPVAFGDKNEFLGLLSHQYLAMKSGKPAQVSTWKSDEEQVSNHLLVIPAAEIYIWLERYFESEGKVSPLMRSVNDQIWGKTVIETAGLRFEMIKRKNSGDDPIGGGDGAGIGGGDGAGIGGTEEQNSDKNKSDSQSIVIKKSNHTAAWIYPKREAWYKSVLSQITLWSEIKVPYLVDKSQNWKALNVQSLEQFFRLLGQDEIHPATVVAKSQSVQVLDELKKMRELATETKSAIEKIEPLLDPTEQRDALEIVRLIKTFSDFLNSPNWAVLEACDFETLLARENGWKILFNLKDQFENSISIYSKLGKIQDLLKKIRI